MPWCIKWFACSLDASNDLSHFEQCRLWVSQSETRHWSCGLKRFVFFDWVQTEPTSTTFGNWTFLQVLCSLTTVRHSAAHLHNLFQLSLPVLSRYYNQLLLFLVWTTKSTKTMIDVCIRLYCEWSLSASKSIDSLSRSLEWSIFQQELKWPFSFLQSLFLIRVLPSDETESTLPICCEVKHRKGTCCLFL